MSNPKIKLGAPPGGVKGPFPLPKKGPHNLGGPNGKFFLWTPKNGGKCGGRIFFLIFFFSTPPPPFFQKKLIFGGGGPPQNISPPPPFGATNKKNPPSFSKIPLFFFLFGGGVFSLKRGGGALSKTPPPRCGEEGTPQIRRVFFLKKGVPAPRGGVLQKKGDKPSCYYFFEEGCFFFVRTAKGHPGLFFLGGPPVFCVWRREEL